MKIENTLVAHIAQPEDTFFCVPWNRLSVKSRTTLRWTMSRAGINFELYKDGFNFDLLKKITLEDLKDTKNVGAIRAQELIDEIEELYSKPLRNLNPNAGAFLEESSVLENALNTSLVILAYLSVEESVGAYQTRIAKNAVFSEKNLLEALNEFRTQKSQGWFIFKKKADSDSNLFRIVQSQLRLSYVVARNVYPELDIRAKVIAGNLGLLGAIKTFDLESSMSFSAYAEPIIEDFIKNLVFLGNLEYLTIEKMLLEGNSLTPLQPNKVFEPLLMIQIDANLAEVLEFIEMKFRRNPKIDDRTLTILKGRLPIFANVPKTLDSIAKDWGVTRERIRQITVRWGNLKLKEPLQIDCLKIAVDCLSESKNEEEFMMAMGALPVIGEIPLSASRLRAICDFFVLSELVKRIDEVLYTWEHADEVQGQFKQEIKKLRSPLGLYDMSFLMAKFDVPRIEIEKTISSIYPRTIFVGNLALARTKNLDTMFENSVAKQLFVVNTLKVSDLIIGLERTASYRGVPLLGDERDLGGLIKHLAGETPSYENISSKLIKPITLQRIESWLVEVFSQAAGPILHSNELVTKAINDEVNVSSLQVYLINSSILRSHGGSIYSLIGSVVDSEIVEMYRKAVLASGKPSEIDFTISSEGIELRILPNLNAITSGIIFPPSGLKRMVIGYVFDSTCLCGNLVSKQQVKFTASGFWTGFTAMIRHGMSEHKMDKDSEFVFVFDFERSLVVLQTS